LAASGAPPEAVAAAKRLFDPEVLTLGFARRFATYKRPDLMLHDPARLMRILSNAERPVQLIIAGKAHPEDKPGQALIQKWINFIRQPEMRQHVKTSMGSMWNQRHEGAGQWRPQSVRTRWLVGRSLRP
jgi:starch phosphorylase